MSDELTIAVITLPLVALWVLAVAEVVRRRDLGAGPTIGWVAALLLVPLLGLVAYVVVRPARAVESSRAPGDTTIASAVVDLAERRQRGELDDDTYVRELQALRTVPPG